jgi:hypothetical protein
MPLPLTARRVAPLRAPSSRCAARCASLRPPGDMATSGHHYLEGERVAYGGL